MSSNTIKTRDLNNNDFKYYLTTNNPTVNSYTFTNIKNNITLLTNEKQTTLEEDELKQKYSRKKAIEKLDTKYRDKINNLDMVLVKANDIMYILKDLWQFKILIQYTSKKSLFFIILKENYEIHLEYLFKENEEAFYSIYKSEDCLEIGNDSLYGSIERIYFLLQEH